MHFFVTEALIKKENILHLKLVDILWSNRKDQEIRIHTRVLTDQSYTHKKTITPKTCMAIAVRTVFLSD